MQPDDNPYAPPSEAAEALPGYEPDRGLQVLATRERRFAAWTLDQLALAVTLAPFGYAMVSDERLGLVWQWLGRSAAWLLLPAALTAYQWYLVAKAGQSLGKRWMGVRIVMLDGSDAGFLRAVVLRAWLPGALTFVPYLGGAVSLADALAIFGRDRRCLHDRLAGTKVIEAETVAAAD